VVLQRLHRMSPPLRPSYLAAQVLAQARPARGAQVDDGLPGAQRRVALGGVVLVPGVDHQPAHLDQAVPLVFVEVGRATLVPEGGRIETRTKNRE